ncbi:MAG: hypothetical protein IVW55_11565 [Chloroflexi bacterium]|nr:hypothetical protein [Chloroflexota bacterium]
MDSLYIPFVILVIVIAALSLVWRSRRSLAMLQEWASRNGYSLLRYNNAYFFRGPFFWTSSKGQVVYRVVVADGAGNTRSGWVRLGSWWLGLLSDEAEARWDA